MSSKAVRVPGPDHPITVEANRRRVLVRHGHSVIADTDRALTLREADYPPVHYIPAMDVIHLLLARSDHRTYCPFKGDCSYFHIESGDGIAKNAAWSYEAPYEAVRQIEGHYAFYSDRVEIVEQG